MVVAGSLSGRPTTFRSMAVAAAVRPLRVPDPAADRHDAAIDPFLVAVNA